MFVTATPGPGYGYGAQQFGPLGYLGNLYGQVGQPGGVQTAGPFGQQLGGQQQPGGQLGGGAGGMAQGFLPFGAVQGIPGYGYATPQTVLPLTVAPGTVPFQQTQQTQPQLGLWQYGASQLPFGQQPFGQQPFGQQPFGQQQLGPVQPQLQVIPVLTPQGLVGQLVLTIGQQPGGGFGAGLGGQQFGQPSVAPWPTTGYGYGVPQISPQAMMGGVQPGFGGGGFGSQFGGVGGLGGGYSPFQAQQQIPQQQIPQQQIPQQQIPQMYVPVIPIGTSFPGQPLGAVPIH
ncbi:MAG: hypothetical protein ACJ8DC_08140 [Gemmatimonadales bacterium]